MVRVERASRGETRNAYVVGDWIERLCFRRGITLCEEFAGWIRAKLSPLPDGKPDERMKAGIRERGLLSRRGRD